MQIDHIFIKNLDENNNILGWTPLNSGSGVSRNSSSSWKLDLELSSLNHTAKKISSRRSIMGIPYNS